MNSFPRILAAACCAVPLLLTSCSDGDSGDGGSDGTSASAPQISDTPGTPVAPSTAEEPDSPSSPAIPSPPAGAPSIEVRATEVQGVVLLTSVGPLDGEPRQITGRLVTGPGGCLSLTMRDRPELVVFPAETVLTPGRPSVQLPGGEQIYVGDQATFPVLDATVGDLAGAPERCVQGAASTGYVVAS